MKSSPPKALPCPPPGARRQTPRRQSPFSSPPRNPLLDLTPYRQDEDFYYLTGWTEPGAALMVVGEPQTADAPRGYKEILFLPTRDLRMEKYTGVKLDAASPGVARPPASTP